MGAALNQMYRRLDAHACEELIKSRPKPAPLRVLLAAFGCHALASAVGGGSRRSMLYAYHVAHPAGHCRPHKRTSSSTACPGRYHVDVLAFHWLTALACLDKCGVHDRLRVSEVALVDPLTTFFSYGLLRAANRSAQEPFRPRALFGVRSNLVGDRRVDADKAATVRARPVFPAHVCCVFPRAGEH